MGLKNLLYSKGKQQNEKTTYRMRENICEQHDQQGIKLQHIQTAQAVQFQRDK